MQMFLFLGISPFLLIGLFFFAGILFYIIPFAFAIFLIWLIHVSSQASNIFFIILLVCMIGTIIFNILRKKFYS